MSTAQGATRHPTYARSNGHRAHSPEQVTGTRALIVDDHKLFAEAIRPLLLQAGMEVVGIAMSEVEAMEAVREHNPDIVIMDLGLPDSNGIDVGSRIMEEYPQTKVVIVTALHDPKSVRDALRAGCSGYLTKDTPAAQFVSSLGQILSGDVVLPQRLAYRALGAPSPDEENARLRASQLTSREKEVLALLIRGAGSPEIAEALCVSVNTVRTHIQNVLTKLQVHTRLEAAAFAVRYAIVPLE